jgi:hypothetical protein
MNSDQPEFADQSGSAEDGEEAERRAFLAKCGRFAVVTPPAIAMLLSTSLNANAQAVEQSGEHKLPVKKK